MKWLYMMVIKNQSATKQKEDFIHRQILFSLSRHICESAVIGSDCLWLGPLWGLPLCLMEALLDTMEGAWAFPHYQGSPRAPQPDYEPSAITACTQAASLHSCGPPDAQPP